jgi:hypothetical protein
MRLRQLLTGDRKFSPAEFEVLVHRDDVHAVVAALLPVARKVVEEDKITDPAVQRLLESLKNWNLRYQSDDPAYPSADSLASSALLAYRRARLSGQLAAGGGGVCQLARILAARFARDQATPKTPAVREYLVNWLRFAARLAGRRQGRGLAKHPMPYQGNGPLRLPSLDSDLDLVSPPLACPNGGTIWSQPSNSYTQIVDLSDIDNSRAVLPPGISEDPNSRFHADQMHLWVDGRTRPAPLSRGRIEVNAIARLALTTVPYKGPDASDEKLARFPCGRFISAIPEETRAIPGRRGRRQPERARPPRQIDAALRDLMSSDVSRADVDTRIARIRQQLRRRPAAKSHVVSSLRRALADEGGTTYYREQINVLLAELAESPTTRRGSGAAGPARREGIK